MTIRLLACAPLLLAMALASACDGRSDDPQPQPPFEGVARHEQPLVEQRDGVSFVRNHSARERLIPREGIPRNPLFLFAGIAAAAHRADGSQAVLHPSGERLLVFDAAGRFRRALGQDALLKGIAVTAGDAGWVVADRDGEVVLLDEDAPPARLFETPFGTGVIASFAGGFAAARSPFAITLEPELPPAPLIVRTTPAGRISARVDTVRRVPSRAASFLANTGHLAAADSMLYFAFLTMDEVRAYDPGGRARWVSRRPLPWADRPPEAERDNGTPRLQYHAVNLGLAVQREYVWVLSYADTLEQHFRLDALEAETGVLARTATLPARPALLSLDQEGALWVAPADTLGTIAAPPKRTALQPFRLPTTEGDTFDLAALRGRVVLLNVWASWCGPCRDEFPLMNRLAREYADRDLAIVAVNEDVSERAARRFLAEFAPEFVVPLGRGRMQDVLRYRGLPYTLLLDREGRIVRRFFGFGGETQFAELRRAIDRALAE